MCAVGGCQFDPRTDYYTTSQPQASSVVGVYRLDVEGLNRLPPERIQAAVAAGKRPTVVLYANGVFAATNFPVWKESVDSESCSLARFVSTRGHWKIDSVGDLDGKTLWSVRFDPPTQPEAAGLMGDKPPYALYWSYSDPDAGIGMSLTKASGTH